MSAYKTGYRVRYAAGEDLQDVKQTYSASTANVRVLPENYSWTGGVTHPTQARPLPKGTNEVSPQSDMEQRVHDTAARDKQRETDMRTHAAAVAAALRADREAGKIPASSSVERQSFPSVVRDPNREEGIRGYSTRLIVEGGGSISPEQAWQTASDVWQQSRGLMDHSFATRERYSPANVLAGMRGGGGPAVVAEERTTDYSRLSHTQRAQRHVEMYHKRGQSIAWSEALAATAPRLYQNGRQPTDTEVLRHVELVNGGGRRSLSFEEAMHELVNA
jgi:hypothetical protein